jgi:transposase
LQLSDCGDPPSLTKEKKEMKKTENPEPTRRTEKAPTENQEGLTRSPDPKKPPQPRRTLPHELDQLYTGIDVAQESLSVAVVDGLGNVISASTPYPNTLEGHERLWRDTQAISKRLQLPIAYAMEASGIYHMDLLYFLLERKARAKSYNPLLLREEKGGSIRKTKTDPIDARRIAEYDRTKGQRHPYAQWDDDYRRLRERCRVRQRLVSKSSNTQRQLHRNLDVLVPGLAGVLGCLDNVSSLAACLAIFRQTRFPNISQEELEAILKPFHIIPGQVPIKAAAISQKLRSCNPPGGMVEPLIDEVKFLVNQIELFQEQLRQEEGRIAKEMEKRETLLTSVPGMGPITAAVVLSEIGNPHRFQRVEQIVAFGGVDPSKRESGKFRGRGNPISKRGSPLLRTALFQAAGSVAHMEGVGKDFFEKLRAKGKPYKVAIVALSRKILIWCWIVLRDGVAWDATRARGTPRSDKIPEKSATV